MTKYIRHPEQPVCVNIKLVGGLYIKETVFPCNGMIAPQHSHDRTHVSGIAYGAVEVEKDGVSMGRFDAPALITIEAKVKHTFRILVPDTCVWCIFSVADVEGGMPVTYEEHHLDMIDEP